MSKKIANYALSFESGMWRSWLAHHVRDVGVVCSSQIIPTKTKRPTQFCAGLFFVHFKKSFPSYFFLER